MRDCHLTVYGEGAKVLVERRVVVPPLPERSLLERLYREHIEGVPVRYAVAREDRVVRALYLAEDLVPRTAFRFGGRKGRVGRWSTTAVQVGQGVAGRMFFGPELFFRQIDLGADESWLAPVLMAFGHDVEVAEHRFPDGSAWAWDFRDEHFLFVQRATRWILCGAGNTPSDRVERVLEAEKPQSTVDLLWSLGCVPIARSKSKLSLQGV